MAEQQHVSLTWAQYLASPVNVALVSLALDAYLPEAIAKQVVSMLLDPSCPQTSLIGRNTEGEQLTPEANAP